MNEADELQIIQRIVDGEIEAFEHLVLHYQDRLLRMIEMQSISGPFVA